MGDKFEQWCCKCYDKLWTWMYENPNNKKRTSTREAIVVCSAMLVFVGIGFILYKIIF